MLLQSETGSYLLEGQVLTGPITKSPYLTANEYKRTRDVFNLFASLEFCGSITFGSTQNSNESVPPMNRHHSPKAKQFRQKSLIGKTAMAVLSFNDGCLVKAALLKELGEMLATTLEFFARRENLRNLRRKRRILETYKRKRQMHPK